MNHWKETAEIVARLGEIEAAGHRAALATVVRIVGSAYRRPGAKLLIEEGGGSLGSVSGGCLEADVREVAKAVLDSGQPWLRHYDTADESILWGLGLGCNGSVDVLVQPATAGPLKRLLPRLGELFAGDAPFALATLLPAGTEPPPATGASPSRGDRSDRGEAGAGEVALVESGGIAPSRGLSAAGAGKRETAARDLADELPARARAALAAGTSGVQEAGGRRIFVEVQQPPPHLLVCGAGDDAKPLVAYAADVGFRVTVIDHRPALLDPAWFAQASRRVVARPEDLDVDLPAPSRSLAVVKTHSLHHDREWVRRLLAAGLPYIGVLGPRARTESILRDVAAGAAGGAGAAGAADAAAAASRAGAAARPGAWGNAGAAGGRPAAVERVFGPVGLDLGADGPRQVAVSIVAELLAFTAHREPRHLSERREAIHAG
jgi:xanthine dehydrogenase accessory factor